MDSEESQPLLQERHREQCGIESGRVHRFLSWLDPDKHDYHHTPRERVQHILSSKLGHYLVLLLVSVDVSCIFADFLIKLYVCDHSCKEEEEVSGTLGDVQDALGIVSLVFSCLFVLELLVSVWAFSIK